MTLFRPLVSLCLLALFASTAVAQRGPGRANVPEAGSQLPDVLVYDEQGNEFSTKNLRGHHTVLVFGCLT